MVTATFTSTNDGEGGVDSSSPILEVEGTAAGVSHGDVAALRPHVDLQSGSPRYYSTVDHAGGKF